MKFIETLAAYVPSLIVEQLLNDTQLDTPHKHSYETVCCFADISGYTALSEAMVKQGEGAEGLARHLNAYFSQMVRIIAGEGGDVFKYAGDAMIVLWPKSDDDMDTRVRRATQCACYLQKELNDLKMGDGVRLSMKVGIGVGKVSILHIGGSLNRMEYLAAGDPLVQAFQAEHHAVSGQVILSKKAWDRVSGIFQPEEVFSDGYVRLNVSDEAVKKFKKIPKRSKVHMLSDVDLDDGSIEQRLKPYVAGAVLPTLSPDSPEDESYGAELRQLTVLFVNLGLQEHDFLAAAEYDEAMLRVHNALKAVQAAVYQYEGSVNKFLMDDKGSTLLAAFGLPPFAHENDALRAVMSSLLICEKLFDLGLTASVGITTGTNIFAGTVGSKTRREYSVLGDSVNLSARLMQRVCQGGCGGVLVDKNTKILAASGGLIFEELDAIEVKGKTGKIEIFMPYTHTVADARAPPGEGVTNVMREAHAQQRRAWARRSLLEPRRPHGTVHAAVIRRSMTPAEAGGGGAAGGGMGMGGVGSGHDLTMSTKNRKKSSFIKQNKDKPGLLVEAAVAATMTDPKSTGAGTHSQAQRVVALPLEAWGDNEQYASHGSGSSGGSSGGGSGIGGGKLVPPVAPLADIQSVLVVLPQHLRLDEVQRNSPQVGPIPIIARSSFKHLFDLTLQRAVRTELIKPEDAAQTEDLELNIRGASGPTRCFLLKSELNIKWLPHFVREANKLEPELNDSQASEPEVLELTLVRSREKVSIQSHNTLLRFKLLERKIQLLEAGVGAAVIVEGEVGSGKTTALCRFLATTLPGTATTYCTAGSPFDGGSWARTSFGVWWAIALQYLTAKAAAAGDTSANPTTPADVALTDVRAHAPDFEWCASLLNEPLALEVKAVRSKSPSHDLRRVRGEQRRLLECLGQLLLALLKGLAAWRTSVIVIDDGLCLDRHAWAMALAVASGRYDGDGTACTLAQAWAQGGAQGGGVGVRASPLPLMLVVATRPLRNNMEHSSVPWEYTLFAEHPQTDFMKLGGLPPEEVQDLICEVLGTEVTSISGELQRLVQNKTFGNPLAAKEFVLSLLHASPAPALCFTEFDDTAVAEADEEDDSDIDSDLEEDGVREGLHCALVGGFDSSGVEEPPSVCAMLGSRFDRLNSCQKMILKTASLIPTADFKYRLMEAAYPIDGHKHRLERECLALEALGLIRIKRELHVTTGAGGGDEGDEDKASGGASGSSSNNSSSQKNMTCTFAHGFMRNVVKRCMLLQHQDLISARVEKELANEEREQRKRFMKRFEASLPDQGGEQTKLTGMLEVKRKDRTSGNLGNLLKRKVQGSWKRRWVELSSTGFSMYKEEGDRKCTQMVDLKGASCELQKHSADGVENVFEVVAHSYVKNGQEFENQRRTFHLKADNADVAEHWVYMIRYVIERLEMDGPGPIISRSQSSVQKARLAAGKSLTRALSLRSIRYDPSMESVDSILHVTVYRVKPRTSAEVSPPANPFCLLELRGPHIPSSSSSAAAAASGAAPAQYSTMVPVMAGSLEWNEDFAFQLRRKQWPGCALRVSVRDRDYSLSDDFLGSTIILLKDLEVEQWDLDSIEDSAASAERGAPVWHALLPRKTNEPIPLEQICLTVRLVARAAADCMPPPADSDACPDAAALGGVGTDSDAVPAAQAPGGAGAATAGAGAGAGIGTGMDSLSKVEQLIQICALASPSSAGHANAELSSAVAAPMSAEAMAAELTALKQILLAERSVGVGASAGGPAGAAVLPSNASPTKLHGGGGGGGGGDGDVKEYYYLDAQHIIQGPFTRTLMRAWLRESYMHAQVQVRRGPSGAFLPMASHAELADDASGAASSAKEDTWDMWAQPRELELSTAAAAASASPGAGAGAAAAGGASAGGVLAWDFDTIALHKCAPLDFARLPSTLLHMLGLHAHFDIGLQKFRAFVSAVYRSMDLFQTPFHNVDHAVDVLHTVFVFLKVFDVQRVLSKVEQLGIFVAALCHDLEHPGLSNVYQVNARTPLALRYNDTSVLESHHCSCCFAILSRGESNIFCHFSEETYKEIRQVIIGSILATDMKSHFGLKESLEHINWQDVDASTDDELVLKKQDRELLMKAVLHASDISNPCKPWLISEKWRLRVVAEFFAEGDREKREGLPVTPNMDRETVEPFKLQLGFIDFIVAPFYNCLSAKSRVPKLQVFCDSLASNRDRLAAMAAEASKESTS